MNERIQANKERKNTEVAKLGADSNGPDLKWGRYKLKQQHDPTSKADTDKQKRLLKRQHRVTGALKNKKTNG